MIVCRIVASSYVLVAFYGKARPFLLIACLLQVVHHQWFTIWYAHWGEQMKSISCMNIDSREMFKNLLSRKRFVSIAVDEKGCYEWNMENCIIRLTVTGMYKWCLSSFLACVG